MTDTFYPPIQPSPQGTQLQEKPRLLVTTFGDGIKQTTPDGLNPVDRTATVTWSPIQATDADTIVAFLNAHIGQTFFYCLPREIAPRAWVEVGTRQRTYPYPNQDALTITLEERHIY